MKLTKPSNKEASDEIVATEVQSEAIERTGPFKFSMVHIPIGAVLEYSNRGNENSSKTCIVVDDKTVEFEGKQWSLSALATELTHSKWSVAGPRYFKYKGEWLNEIRKRLGV